MYPKGVYPLKQFLQNFAWGRKPQDRILVPNFTVVALKVWPYGPKNPQWYILVKICPSGKILGVDRKS